MGDIVDIKDVPPGLVMDALSAARDPMEEMVTGVLWAAGHHLITDESQAELGQRLERWLPADPYERREALDDITRAVLAIVGVRHL